MTVGTYQPGRSALIQYGNQTSPESYTNIGGLRNVELTMDSGPVEVTNKDSSGWKTYLAAGGVAGITIRGQGLFDSSSSLKSALAAGNPVQISFFAKIVFGNGDSWIGQWVVRQYQRTGVYNEAETYDLTIESSGAMTFSGGS